MAPSSQHPFAVPSAFQPYPALPESPFVAMNTPGSPPSFPAAPAGFQQVPVGTYAPPPGPPPTSSTNYAPPPGPPPVSSAYIAPPGFPAAASPLVDTPGTHSATMLTPLLANNDLQYGSISKGDLGGLGEKDSGEKSSVAPAFALPPGAEAPPAYQAIQGVEGCPPDYFDISIIPTGNIMLAKDCPPLGERSNAKFEVKDSSIVSFDPSLQKNPEELWKFFLSHLSKPTLLVHILGQHEETFTEVVHGDNGTRVETRSRTVTDFSFNFDVSHYIAPAWSRVVCIPKQGKPSQNYRQALEEFTFSSNIFKEIHMVKQVFWDYPSLTNAIVSAIRRTGYPHRIMVSYPLKNAKIWVFSDHPLSKMAHNTCVNVLCVLTCMCIIFWPILALSKKKISSRLLCEFNMVAAGSTFFAQNYQTIVGAAMGRVHGATYTAL